MGKREREYDPARTLRRMRNFVVAVLLAVLAWLLLSRAYAATRADNALDELYYSTLDSRSCEALWEQGHLSPTVLASALSAYKADSPRNEGIDPWYCRPGRDALSEFKEASSHIYLYGYQDGRTMTAGSCKYLSWYIEDGSDRGHSPVGLGRKAVFRVAFFPESLGGARSKYDGFSRDNADSSTYEATWIYDIDSKAFSLFSVRGPYGDEINGDGAFGGEFGRDNYAERIFGLNGADPVLMVDLSRQAIRDVVLRGYLEGAGLSNDEVESELSEVDPIIDAGVDEAKGIYRDAGFAS